MLTRSFFTHLECGFCGEKLDPDKLWNLCPKCGKPLLARYDLEKASRAVGPQDLIAREPTLWRYRELLPIRDDAYKLSLGEGFTPLLRATRLEEELDHSPVYVKDEGLNPTGSFKARGLCMAISRALELGVKAVFIPSAGNAACAMSAYAALAGLEAHVYMPADVPKPFVNECRVLGASVHLVDGLITDCGKAARADLEKYDRFDVSTLKEPYRIEGKKTMGYELAEQLGWTLPDVIIYPTGGGTGLVGMWKAFEEMEKLAWVGSKRPRLVTVQSDGCAPIVKAFHQGKEFADQWQNARTIADGLRVPAAIGDFLMLRALRESKGTAVAVPDSEILQATYLLGKTAGIWPAPEGGATLAAFLHLKSDGWIKKGESVVLFNTGNGAKYSRLWD
ncbi:MAG: threonine synthase [Candidatus Saccharicenans sp.]|uniref:threonine synthase n=1 Tax=Candidatus Saccharicenans sp. TaxID=2819258 RepID=UPI00404A0CCA